MSRIIDKTNKVINELIDYISGEYNIELTPKEAKYALDNQKIEIYGKEIDLTSIDLYNSNGQIILEIKKPTKINNNSYQVKDLPNGFYMIQLSSDHAVTTKKVIVN